MKITKHPNGVIAKLSNRRVKVFSGENDTVINIEVVKLLDKKNLQISFVNTKIIDKKISVLGFSLSKEAALALYKCLKIELDEDYK